MNGGLMPRWRHCEMRDRISALARIRASRATSRDFTKYLKSRCNRTDSPIAPKDGASRDPIALRLSQLTTLSELVQPAQSSRPVPTSGFGVVA